MGWCLRRNTVSARCGWICWNAVSVARWASRVSTPALMRAVNPTWPGGVAVTRQTSGEDPRARRVMT